jgi:hypothetical protein
VTLVKGREVWRLVGAEQQQETSVYIHEITQILKRFVRGEGEHKALYDRLLQFLDIAPTYDEQKARLLLYFIVLVDLGYADAKSLGVKNIQEYNAFSVDDLYTHLVLSYDVVRSHITSVLQEIHL